MLVKVLHMNAAGVGIGDDGNDGPSPLVEVPFLRKLNLGGLNHMVQFPRDYPD